MPDDQQLPRTHASDRNGGVGTRRATFDQQREGPARVQMVEHPEHARLIREVPATAHEHAERALRLAVTHGGDSDSTASLTGQLLGARYGMAIFGEDAEVPVWITDSTMLPARG